VTRSIRSAALPCHPEKSRQCGNSGSSLSSLRKVRERSKSLQQQQRDRSGRDQAGAHDEMYRFFPGGVIDIDPKTVVASVRPRPMKYFPRKPGLFNCFRQAL